MGTDSALRQIAMAGVLVVLWATTAAAQPAERPTVLKGTPAERSVPADVPEPGPAVLEVAAGEDLWLIDRTGGDLIACRLLNTSTVGKRVIRCFERRLPAGLRRIGADE